MIVPNVLIELHRRGTLLLADVGHPKALHELRQRYTRFGRQSVLVKGFEFVRCKRSHILFGAVPVTVVCDFLGSLLADYSPVLDNILAIAHKPATALAINITFLVPTHLHV